MASFCAARAEIAALLIVTVVFATRSGFDGGTFGCAFLVAFAAAVEAAVAVCVTPEIELVMMAFSRNGNRS